MNSNEGINRNSPVIQQSFPPEEALFSPCMIISLVVAGVAATAFAVLAYLHILYPMSAFLAGGIGGSVVLFIAIHYFSRECCPPPSVTPIRRGELVNLPCLIIPPITNEQWGRFLSLPLQRANLIDGTDVVAPNSASGFMQIPYIGTYESYDRDLRLSQVQWRLPPSQLRAFPEAMQRLFARHAENGNLEIFFLATNRPGESGIRNLVMHPLVLPEYSNEEHPNGLFSDVEMRIYEPHGIAQYQNLRSAIPFGDQGGDVQRAYFHRGEDNGIAISPNNARFVIQDSVDYCSFYLAARYRGRACACYIIINRANEENNVWQNVVASSSTLIEFIENLSESDFPYKENVLRLLQREQL